MIKIFLSFFFLVLGTAVGSFLNCVIFRLERGKSFLKGRSFCPHCKHLLGWKDLIPILSFILLKGKCRYCKNKISFQYPVVEFLTGILAFFCFFPLIQNFSLFNLQSSIFNFLFFCLLILIFVFDLKHYLIPDQILNFTIFLSFLYRVFNFSGVKNLFFSLFPSLFFLGLILISKEKWMGWGDFEIAIFMGIFLGWPKILIALFFSFFTGALVGLILVFLKKKTLKSQIPFAPFLVSGTFFALLFSQNLIDFYFSLF
jgi:leader peptidase (prepilin peptidase)/N-methyltransferase